MASGDSGDSPSKAATAVMGRGCKGCWAAMAVVFSQYLKQIKYQMLVVVHPHSDENVRLRWGF